MNLIVFVVLIIVNYMTIYTQHTQKYFVSNIGLLNIILMGVNVYMRTQCQKVQGM